MGAIESAVPSRFLRICRLSPCARPEPERRRHLVWPPVLVEWQRGRLNTTANDHAGSFAEAGRQYPQRQPPAPKMDYVVGMHLPPEVRRRRDHRDQRPPRRSGACHRFQAPRRQASARESRQAGCDRMNQDGRSWMGNRERRTRELSPLAPRGRRMRACRPRRTFSRSDGVPARP